MSHSRRGGRSCRGLAVVAALVALLPGCAALRASDPAASPGPSVNSWVTSADRSRLLAPQAPLSFFGARVASGLPTIRVDPALRYQAILGLGASLTDSSSWLIGTALSAAQRDQLLASLFSPAQGIGISLLRQPLGATDFSASGNWSYDDLPVGGVDPTLAHFSIHHDQAYTLPQVRQALALNPALSVIASSWSAPAWMKTSGSLAGGTLTPADTSLFGAYLVKAVQAYRAAGVTITSLSPQNEPLTTPGTSPGMYASASDEEAFVRDVLGPALKAAGLPTTVLGVEDSWSEADYADTLLKDPAAAAFFSGTAWHCYHGLPGAMTDVHNVDPTKLVLETECSGGTWQPPQEQLQGIVRDGIIASLRNWSSSVVAWNIALDPSGGPNNGGCTTCRGLVTIDRNSGAVTYNMDYYGLAAVSKFVVPGAHRIDSTGAVSGLSSVALQNPDGSQVLVVYNESASAQRFAAAEEGRAFVSQVPGRSVATYTWRSPLPSSRSDLTPTGL